MTNSSKKTGQKQQQRQLAAQQLQPRTPHFPPKFWIPDTMAAVQTPPGMPQPMPDQLAQIKLQQQQHAFQLQQQAQMNLQKAEMMPSVDEEGFTPFPCTMSICPPQPPHPAFPMLTPTTDTPPEHLIFLEKANNLSRIFASAPPNAIPPPPGPQHTDKSRSEKVNAEKEKGNAFFKRQQYPQSIAAYSFALQIAASRMPWESQVVSREEMSIVLCNRSAAFGALGEWDLALTDADSVIKLRRNWSKGHFRKAKALLSLHRYQEAKLAIELGLEFEPTNNELSNFLEEIENAIKDEDEDEENEKEEDEKK